MILQQDGQPCTGADMQQEQQYLRVIFSRSNHIFSTGIRVYDTIQNSFSKHSHGFTQFSHAGIIDGNIVVESTWSLGGVKEATLAEFKSRATHWCIVDIPVLDSQKAVAAIREQLGKPYDKTAIAGFLLRNRNFEETDAWFCIELIAYGLNKGGTHYFKPKIHNAVTPDMLFWRVPHTFVDCSGNFVY